jgi:DNA-binding transcriptional ArsR family regulator
MQIYTDAVPEPGRHQPVAEPLPDLEAEELAQAMAAFTTASRLKLLYALIGVERTVEDLTDATRLGPNVVSQQLRVLRLLRLASSRRDGRHVRYRLYDAHVVELLAAIRYHGEHASAEDQGTAEARA